jgi:hypothetical protein
MNGDPGASWWERIRARANAAQRRSVTAIIFAAIAVTAGWDSANPSRFSQVTVLYVGAADCAPCRIWQSRDGAYFRTSKEFARVSYREVKSPTLRGVLNDDIWPDDLRRYRGQLGGNSGVPAWIVVGDGEVQARGFGVSQWQTAILPSVRALIR